MKISFLITAFLSIVISSCHEKNENLNKNPGTEEILEITEAEWSDFGKATAFKHISEVPFMLYSERDHIFLYTEALSASKRKNIANQKLNRYYGVMELNDFYEIVFSIDNDSRKTIKAFVKKEDFVRDSKLSLSNVDLNSIRYLMVYEETTKDKTFERKGDVQFVRKEEFEQKKRNHYTDLLVKNPEMQLVQEFWVNGKGIRVPSFFSDEEEDFRNEYTGRSDATDIEIFHQTSAMSMTDYYPGYRSFSDTSPFITFSGHPVFSKDGASVFSFSNHTEVGTDFILYLYDPSVDTFKNYLTVNFVNFKADFSEQPFWSNSKTLYFTATHPNTHRNTEGYRYEYLKLTLK